jgi:FAD/FMN-containing dehydrogenase
VQCGGSFSAEHGIGRKLAHELERLTAPREFALFRDIKHLFDPKGLMNPGAVLSRDNG